MKETERIKTWHSNLYDNKQISCLRICLFVFLFCCVIFLVAIFEMYSNYRNAMIGCLSNCGLSERNRQQRDKERESEDFAVSVSLHAIGQFTFSKQLNIERCTVDCYCASYWIEHRVLRSCAYWFCTCINIYIRIHFMYKLMWKWNGCNNRSRHYGSFSSALLYYIWIGPLFLFVCRLTDDILQSANNQPLPPIHIGEAMETIFCI